MSRALVVAIVLVVGTPAFGQTPQAPWKGENLQFFPKDISRQDLTQRMREFSFALSMRCEDCHVLPNAPSFDNANFASDDRPTKVMARAMLRMVDNLNTAVLPKLPSHADPRVEVTCATCHRGLRLPKSLQTTLFEIIDKEGVPAAVARYRSLRQDTLVFGRYNFDEWEINELARRLVEAKKVDAAIAMLELNGEFNLKSAAIDFQIGELHRMRGERDLAIQRYRLALTKAPKHPGVIQRLAELEKKHH